MLVETFSEVGGLPGLHNSLSGKGEGKEQGKRKGKENRKSDPCCKGHAAGVMAFAGDENVEEPARFGFCSSKYSGSFQPMGENNPESLTRALGDVEKDGFRSPVQLVPDLGRGSNAGGEFQVEF
jgi:hypothetical protein